MTLKIKQHLNGILLLAAFQILFFTPKPIVAQTSSPINPYQQWNAYWIAPANVQGSEYGVYCFRKNFDLEVRPNTFLVKVSADNRYKLYINGHLISLGPARGDTYYWNYETVDLAPYLNYGRNTIAALVWNEAQYRPEAQISLRTGFILQGKTQVEEIINTNNTWKCKRNDAYQPLTGIGYPTYYVAGPGELVNVLKNIKGWQETYYNDFTWPDAITIDRGKPKGLADAFGWMLVPSTIPQMELSTERIPVLRRAVGVRVPSSFPATQTSFTVPANTNATLLVDQTYLTNAYLTLKFSEGLGAGISLTYAESPFISIANGTLKGNRNDVDGTIIAGRKDSIICDGSNAQTYTTLNWRTFRYILITIHTGSFPLIIDDIYGTFTGYPFKVISKFQTGNTEFQKILDIGWRTARLDAVETYMDCPYYEQLEYIGDTRIQALVSYYNSGDDRLARNAINLMDHSRISEGLTLSRHPSYSPQIISTFSLWYIGMLHDYWMYRPDSTLVKEKLSAVREILRFFAKYQQEDGSLKNTPYWTFVDWVDNPGWKSGMPPKGSNGNSAILDLQLLWAYQQAAKMEASMGLPDLERLYTANALQLKRTIQNKYWDQFKQLYADTENKDVYSQHTNSLAILTGMLSDQDAKTLGKKLLIESTLTQCTIYFKYYLHQALVKSGLGNDYIEWLDIWKKNMSYGLTTWAEISDLEHNRSDCHAWGSSPNIEFYRTVLGIDSYSPGFNSIKIEPNLGKLNNLSGEIPHPKGKIKADYKLVGTFWEIKISIPQNTSGIFIWKGKSYNLVAGDNNFSL